MKRLLSQQLPGGAPTSIGNHQTLVIEYADLQ
jgi:hypothetical protein